MPFIFVPHNCLKMKNLSFLIILVLFGFVANIQAQESNDAISQYFNKYMEDSRFTAVYISPKLFQIFDKMDLQLEEEEAQVIMDMVKDMKGLRILVGEDMQEGEGIALYEEATQTIDTKGFETLMTVRTQDQENVQFFIKEDGEDISELLLMVGSQDEFVLMSFLGNIDLSKIGELQRVFDEDGDWDDDDDHDGQY